MKQAEITDNRIHKIYSEEEASWYPKGFLSEVPDDAEEGFVWNGKAWVLPMPEPPKATIEQQVGFLMAKTLGLEVEVSPEELSALTATSNVVALSDEAQWRAGVRASHGLIVLHDDTRYECIQPHVTQSDWPPNATPALWKLLPAIGDNWPEFVQPTGAHDAYAIGAQITFQGKRYISKIPANTYSPAAYPAGWEEVSE